MNSVASSDRRHLWPSASLLVIPGAFIGLHQVNPLRAEHLLVAGILLVCAWSQRGRRFSLVVAPLAAVGFGYELFPLLAKLRGEVLVSELWNLEHLLFQVPGTSTALSDVASSFSWAPLDLLTGATYLTHLPETMGLAVFFFVRGDFSRAQRLALGFFVLNVIGWCLWVAFPAAPPWYVDQYGLGPAQLGAPASAAGGVRFDTLIGRPFFEGFYARSTNVFGAFPSLHAGYATIAALAGYSSSRPIRRFTIGYAVVMCFSAVYLRHHYLVDVVAGIACAVLAHWIASSLLKPPALPSREDARVPAGVGEVA